MAGSKIPLLSHLRAGLIKTLQLVSETTNATAEALLEMQENLDSKLDISVYDPAGTGEQVAFQSQFEELREFLFIGELSTILLDSEGNTLLTSAGEALAVNWKYKRE